MQAANPPRRPRPWQPLSEARFFEAALKTRPCARSEHFFVHRVPLMVIDRQLSTSPADREPLVVDDSLTHLGMMVPKRHAKRAVTRNLVKRQIRAAFDRHVAGLPPSGPQGMGWLVRLRAPINKVQFPSARSEALARALREELDPLFAKLAEQRPATPG